MVFNTCTAIEAIRSLSRFGYVFDNECIAKGISKAVMPARCELIKKKPTVILDGGHNEGCALALSDFIKKHLSGKRIIMVSSMMADKDYDAYLRIIAPLADIFIATKADVPRALGSDALCEAASVYCKNCNSVQNPLKAVNAARNIAENDDVVIVCGSFYLAGEVREDLMNF
jgi:dihydrofolate synthase/folylpolyglutamate synthase